MTTTELRPSPPAAAPAAARAGRAGLLRATALMSLVLAAACVASVLVGSTSVPWDAVLAAGGADHAVAVARVGRTLAALVAGGALGLAGACLQGLARNPLADPGLLGLNAGAAFAMIVAIAFLGVSDLGAYVWFAFAGAAATGLTVQLVASRVRGGATPLTLVITGAAVTAALTSWVSAILLTDRQTLEAFRFWSVGTVGARTVDEVLAVLPFVVVGGALALLSGRVLDSLALGDDLSRGLGRHPGRDRALVWTAVVLLAGASTGLAGPIAFVGLVVPHLARAVVGPSYPKVLPLSLGYGAALTVLSDTLGRVLLPPTEVQVGVMTALVGAPVFVVLARRSRTGAL
jgi:iron complex transport system permease protein